MCLQGGYAHLLVHTPLGSEDTLHVPERGIHAQPWIDQLPPPVTPSPPPSSSPDNYTGNTILFLPPALVPSKAREAPLLPPPRLPSLPHYNLYLFLRGLGLSRSPLCPPAPATHTLEGSPLQGGQAQFPSSLRLSKQRFPGLSTGPQ